MRLLIANLRWVLSVAALGTTVFGCIAIARAAEEPASNSPSASESEAQAVVLLELADSTMALDFVPNLRGQLVELNLELKELSVPKASSLLDTVQQSEKVAAATNALLVAWIARAGTRVDVFLFDPKGPHLYAQEVAVSDSPSAASEELSVVLRSAIQSRLDGSTLEMAEIALPPKPPATVAAPPKPRPTVAVAAVAPPVEVQKTHFGLGFGGVSERPLSHAPLQVGLALRAWLSVSSARIGAGYCFFPDVKVTTAPADFELSRHPFEMFAGYAISVA